MKKKKQNSAMQLVEMLNPYFNKKNFHFSAYQRNFIIPLLVMPIKSALAHGNMKIAKQRFDKLFFDLGLKYDYDALMLSQYIKNP
jgi:hypothetical protein